MSGPPGTLPLVQRGPPRAMSPRCFRPPPGYRGPPPPGTRGPPPPWAAGYGPPRLSPRQFRPPPFADRSPVGSPPYSPRAMPRRGGPPPPGYIPRGPPRPRARFPPPGARFPPQMYQSAPPSPLLKTNSNHSLLPTEPKDNDDEISIGPPLPVRNLPDDKPPISPKASGYDSGTEVGGGDPSASDYHTEDGNLGDDVIPEEEVPCTRPRAYSKAKPLGDRENRFTSTLRRLSTVRKRNKTKRRNEKQKDLQQPPICDNPHQDLNDSVLNLPGSPAAPMGTTVMEAAGIVSCRPSSTTSKESETEITTSGYLR